MPIVAPLSGTDHSPLPWVTEDDLTCEVRGDAATSAIQAATELLYLLSGRSYGLRQRIYRPRVCPEGCGCSVEWRQYGEAPEWFPTTAGACSCASTSLRIPVSVTVESVSVDGVAMLAGDWEFYDRTTLVRVDGGAWPCCQALSANPDGLVVVATSGSPVPEIGKLAAVELACQLAAIGTPACRLPARVQTITRQGVSWTVLDPQDFLENGRLGLYLVDAFLAAVNPKKLRAPTRVISPDTPRTSVPS